MPARLVPAAVWACTRPTRSHTSCQVFVRQFVYLVARCWEGECGYDVAFMALQIVFREQQGGLAFFVMVASMLLSNESLGCSPSLQSTIKDAQ